MSTDKPQAFPPRCFVGWLHESGNPVTPQASTEREWHMSEYLSIAEHEQRVKELEAQRDADRAAMREALEKLK